MILFIRIKAHLFSKNQHKHISRWRQPFLFIVNDDSHCCLSQNAGRMRKTARSMKKDERKNCHLRGPHVFSLDRLMAIFYSIVEGRVPPSANLFSQVSRRFVDSSSANRHLFRVRFILFLVQYAFSSMFCRVCFIYCFVEYVLIVYVLSSMSYRV